jgi:hypothetical protein
MMMWIVVDFTENDDVSRLEFAPLGPEKLAGESRP